MTDYLFYLDSFLYLFDDPSGDDDPPAGGDDDDPPAGDPPSGDPPAGGDAKKKTYTQDDFDRIIATERRKMKLSTEKTIQDLETFRESANLSAEEIESLNKQIEQLKTTVKTKQQLAEEQKKKLTEEFQSQLNSAKQEAEKWRAQYTESTIHRALVDEAVAKKAINPQQIIALLKPDTQMIEETDDKGNGLNIFTPRVKIMEKDENGKPTLLDLSVEEAVTRMRDMPDKYGNLFEDLSPGGMGGNNQRVATTSMAEAAKTMSPAQYREYRAKQKIKRSY